MPNEDPQSGEDSVIVSTNTSDPKSEGRQNTPSSSPEIFTITQLSLENQRTP